MNIFILYPLIIIICKMTKLVKIKRKTSSSQVSILPDRSLRSISKSDSLEAQKLTEVETYIERTNGTSITKLFLESGGTAKELMAILDAIKDS